MTQDRLQINVRLSPEHSGKLVALTECSKAGTVIIIGNDVSVPVSAQEVAPTTAAGALLSYAIDHFYEKYVRPVQAEANEPETPYQSEYNPEAGYV